MDAVSVLALGVAAKGGKGEKGDKGDPGVSMTVGTTTTGEAGTQASVTNTGTTSDPILNFTIPKGDKGDKGDTGEQGIQGPKGDTGSQGPKGDTGETGPKGDKGDTGLTGPQGPAGRDGAIQYTAGDNITISADNVISATGGGGISFETGDGLKLEDDVLSLDENYVTENVVAQGAYQLMSNDGQLVVGEFISRTTGGSASINSGDATHIYFRGNSVNSTATSASAVIKDQTQETKATLNSDTFIAKAVEDGKADGEYEFTADDSAYGVSLNGDASVTIAFANANLGTIVNATPTSFTSIGFNAYDHANTRAYVIEGNRYQVFGTYTSIAGQTIEINKEVGSYIIPYSFVATTTGYVNVEGGNDTDTMIALVWSGYNYDHEYEAYTEDTIAISGLPEYGMPRVNGVYDEIDFSRQKYVHRIGRDVVANKDNYSNKIYDSTYVYYVLDVQTESAITIDEKYLADDFGTELFTGTTVPVGVVVIYGANLKDKLRTDVLTKSAQTLSDDEKNQVKANIGLPHNSYSSSYTFINALPMTFNNSTSFNKSFSSTYYVTSPNHKDSYNKNIIYTITITDENGDVFDSWVSTGDQNDSGYYNYFGPNGEKYNVSNKVLTMQNSNYYMQFYLKEEYTGTLTVTIKYVKLTIEDKLDAKCVDGMIIKKAGEYGFYNEVPENDYGISNSASGEHSISLGSNNVTSSYGYVLGRANKASSSNCVVSILGSGNDISGNYAGGSFVGRNNKLASGSTVSYDKSNIYILGEGYYVDAGYKNSDDPSSYYASQRSSVYLGTAGWPNKNKYLAFKYGNVYNTGDRCMYGNSIYESLIDNNTSYPASDSAKWNKIMNCWDADYRKDQYLFVIGNGMASESSTSSRDYNYDKFRSNALEMDFDGNTTIYGNLTANNIPACPTDDGTYNLQVSIVDGVPTYSWVSVA